MEDKAVYREIYLTENLPIKPIDVVDGSDIQIDLKIMDRIVTSLIAYLYVIDSDGEYIRESKTANVKDNIVTFIPSRGLFKPGVNKLQVKIPTPDSDLISFELYVICTEDFSQKTTTSTPENPGSGSSPEIPDNVVIYMEDDSTEDDYTVEALLLDKLTLDSDGEHIYLKYGEAILGKVLAGAGGGSGPGTVYCTAIAIDQSDLQFTVEDTREHILTATIYPADCTQIPKWSSSDSNVVTINNAGALTIVGEGTATITVKCGSQSDTMTVTIVDNHIKPIYIRAGVSLNVSAGSYTVYNQGTRGYSYYGVITDSSYDQYKQIIPITAGKKYTIYFADGEGLPAEYAPWLRVMQFSGRTRKTATEWIKTPYTFTADSGNDGVAWNLLIGGVDGADSVTQPNVSTYETWINNNMRIKEVQ